MELFNNKNADQRDFSERFANTLVANNTNLFTAKVFGVMFIGLLITAIIATGLGAYFRFVFSSTEEATVIAGTNVLLGVLLVSALGLLIVSIVIPFVYARSSTSHSLIIPLLLYIVFMGGLLSTLCFEFEWYVIAEAVGVTTLIFGILSLLGILGKGKLNALGLIISGLFFGAFAMWGVLALLSLFGANITELDYALSFIFFVLVMLITVWDVYNIRRIASRSNGDETNLILFCAFSIYTDFINIFIRILILLARLKEK